MTDFGRLRLGMVDGQIRTADVTDRRVLEAFLSVPREEFVPESRRALAYLDACAPLGVPGRAALEPMLLARLVQLADAKATERALVVGCGLGYAAAIFSALAASTVGLEEDPALAAGARERLKGWPGVEIVEGPLIAGAPQFAPFDLIFCDGVVSDGLGALAGQLAPQGRIVAPAGVERATKATVFRRHGHGLSSSASFDAYGPALPGFATAPAFLF